MTGKASRGKRGGFTLVELLVSMGIMVLLLLVLVLITDATRRTWTYTTGKIEEFRDAREAFESITRRLSEATLNTYWDYDNDTSPTKYERQSELRFISGSATTLLTGVNGSNGSSIQTVTHASFFQAPLGYTTSGSYANLQSLLNTWGYYIQFDSDSQTRPVFMNTTPNSPALRYRFRLMELMEPSDSLTLYSYTNGKTVYSGTNSYTGTNWFTVPLNEVALPARVLAENVVALVLLPKLTPQDQTAGGNTYTDASLAPTYLYDSTGTNMTTTTDPNLDPVNQLPPVVQVTMVAVDEASYNRYQTTQSGTTMPVLYSTGLFAQSGSYAADLQTLQTNLTTEKVNYRVFTSNVSIKAAKWSRAQTK